MVPDFAGLRLLPAMEAPEVVGKRENVAKLWFPCHSHPRQQNPIQTMESAFVVLICFRGGGGDMASKPTIYIDQRILEDATDEELAELITTREMWNSACRRVHDWRQL